MDKYQVKIIRLPLPRGPLSEHHPEPVRRPIGSPAEFANEGDALRHALVLQQEGYGAAIVDPQGQEWISVRERALQVFQEERVALAGQLKTAGDSAMIHNKIAELDRILQSL